MKSRAYALCFIFALLIPVLYGRIARLVNGTSPFNGRLEILHNGTWSTVCNDYFKENEGLVACRMLGFESVLLYDERKGEGSGEILLDNVQCQGTEISLLQCEHGGLYNHNCRHSEDVGIVCGNYGILGARLVNGTSPSNGRLEILVNKTWLSVSAFDLTLVSRAACRTLGFESSKSVFVHPSMFGHGPGNFVMRLDCEVLDTGLDQCLYTLSTSEDCKEQTDLGLICSNQPEQLRMTNPIGRSVGNVEIQLSGEWYSLCVSSNEAASVACSQLSLPERFAAPVRRASFRPVESRTLRNGFECWGPQDTILDCIQSIHEYSEFCTSDSYYYGVFCSDSRSLFIHENGIRYPFIEGTNATLKCANAHWPSLINYAWPDNAGGFPHGNKLLIDTLTKAHNGCLVRCEAITSTGVLVQSYTLELLVYYYYRCYYCNADADFHRGAVVLGIIDSQELKTAYVLEPYLVHADLCFAVATGVLLTGLRPLQSDYPVIRISRIDSANKTLQVLSDYVEVTWGHNVTFLCEADSNPHPASITWSGRVNITTKELQIIAADPTKHSGIYTCSVVTQVVNDDERLPLTASNTITVVVTAEKLRLAGTKRVRHDMGRVEVLLHGREWITVCGNYASNTFAKVVCRHLGYPSLTPITISASLFGPKQESDVLVVDYRCTGNETNIFQCDRRVYGYSNHCDTKELGVICSNISSTIYFTLETNAATVAYPLMERTNISLKCETTGLHDPEAKYTWSETAGGRSTGKYLIFDNVTSDHNGRRVKCSSIYNNTSRLVSSDSLVLQVYYKPVIKISSSVNTCLTQRSLLGVCAVSRGHNITILCKAKSNPPPGNITWFGKVSSRTNELQLVAAEPIIHDGPYKCIVETESVAGDVRLPLSSSYQFEIVVQDPPTALKFKLNYVDNKTVTVIENSNVNVFCQASGEPKMLILRGTDRHKVHSQPAGDKQHRERKRELRFVIPRVRCDESGDYTCHVDNLMGNDSKTVRLLVQCVPRMETLLLLQYINIRDNKGYLNIEMISYPTPYMTSVTYQRSNSKNKANNLLIDDKIHAACVARNDVPALVTCNISVVDVTYAYEGVYQIVFSNGLGNTSFNFLLKFEGHRERRNNEIVVMAYKKPNQHTTTRV